MVLSLAEAALVIAVPLRDAATRAIAEPPVPPLIAVRPVTPVIAVLKGTAMSLVTVAALGIAAFPVAMVALVTVEPSVAGVMPVPPGAGALTGAGVAPGGDPGRWEPRPSGQDHRGKRPPDN